MSKRLLFMGPPGSGKGTQSNLLADRLGVPTISTGEVLRVNIAEGTELGVLAERYINDGNFVPDSVATDMVRNRLKEADVTDGFILDGYPRTAPQVNDLDTMLEAAGVGLDGVILLDVPEDVLVDRLLRRAELEGRPDDTEEIIRHRQQVYWEKTAPLIEVYRERGLVLSFGFVGTPSEIDEEIAIALGL